MKIDNTTIIYLKYLLNLFQDEIDVNMSFLNCYYTKSVQLLAKKFLNNFEIIEDIDKDIAEIFVQISCYFIQSFDVIFKEKYERLEYSTSKIKKEFECFELQHKHFLDLVGDSV